MPESQRVLKALQQKYEVFIATAAMEVPTSFAAKYAVAGETLPFYSVFAHCVLRGQGDSAGGLFD